MKNKSSLCLLIAPLLSACITVVSGPGSTPGPAGSPSPGSAAPSAAPSPSPSSQPSATPGPAQPPASVVPSAMVGYEDMFEKPENLSSGWLIEDAPDSASGPSAWHIDTGRLIQDSNIYRNDDEFRFYEGTRAITRQGPWQDVRISVKITPTDNDGVGVIFRYRDADNYYRLLSVQDGLNKGPFTRLEVKRNGSFRTLAEDTGTLHETGEEGVVPVEITLQGPQIAVSVNGQSRFQVSDATFLGGKVGLTTYACSAEFSEFRVRLLR